MKHCDNIIRSAHLNLVFFKILLHPVSRNPALYQQRVKIFPQDRKALHIIFLQLVYVLFFIPLFINIFLDVLKNLFKLT